MIRFLYASASGGARRTNPGAGDPCGPPHGRDRLARRTYREALRSAQISTSTGARICLDPILLAVTPASSSPPVHVFEFHSVSFILACLARLLNGGVSKRPAVNFTSRFVYTSTIVPDRAREAPLSGVEWRIPELFALRRRDGALGGEMALEPATLCLGSISAVQRLRLPGGGGMDLPGSPMTSSPLSYGSPVRRPETSALAQYDDPVPTYDARGGGSGRVPAPPGRNGIASSAPR